MVLSIHKSFPRKDWGELSLKRLILPLCIISLLLCLNTQGHDDVSNAQDELESLPTSSETLENALSETVERIEVDSDSYESLLLQFFNDAGVPEMVREQFTLAVYGDKEAQQWIWEHARQHETLKWPVVETVYNYSIENVENECLFNIAMLYYHGNDGIGFYQDRTKAFEWVKLSAEKGNANAALCAGDMNRYGNGIPIDENAAFEYYSTAHRIKPNSLTFEQLGDCYFYGIGIAADRQQAFDNYIGSAFMGNSAVLYKLSEYAEDTTINLTALYKAASSQSYSGGYWAISYDGLDGYAADNLKHDLMEKLIDTWNSGSDVAASNFSDAISANEYFPASFVEALTQAVYNYSYHAFAEEYGLWPNRNYEDAQNIQFVNPENPDSWLGNGIILAEHFLEWEGCQFYKYDFDGCGEDEIGIRQHSGAGGAFMVDGFGIYKENEDGLYEHYSSGPSCTLRDAKRIIRYDGKIYFIVNWFDDTGYTPHDVTAYTIDASGLGHSLTIKCKDYTLQRVITYTDEAYRFGYDALLSGVAQQIHDAVTATKQQRIYSPDSENQLSYYSEDDWWSDCGGGSYEVTRDDVFFSADIYNNGVVRVVHKGRLITQFKYYNDYNWFQIYWNLNAFENGTAVVKAPVIDDSHYGLHSGGNLYELLPINEKYIIQFWTYEHVGVTYCVTLHKNGLLYVLQIHKVRDGEADFVSKSLFFDAAQGVDISFSPYQWEWE